MSKVEAYALLKDSEKAMTLIEIQDALGISKQNASKSLNRLRLDGDIKVTATPRGFFKYELKR